MSEQPMKKIEINATMDEKIDAVLFVKEAIKDFPPEMRTSIINFALDLLK